MLTDALEHGNEHIRFFHVQLFETFYNWQTFTPLCFLLLFALFFSQTVFASFPIFIFSMETKVYRDKNTAIPIACDKKLKSEKESFIHMTKNLRYPFYFFTTFSNIGIIKY